MAHILLTRPETAPIPPVMTLASLGRGMAEECLGETKCTWKVVSLLVEYKILVDFLN